VSVVDFGVFYVPCAVIATERGVVAVGNDNNNMNTGVYVFDIGGIAIDFVVCTVSCKCN